LYAVCSLPADPLTILHKVSNCQHTTTIMSHNLQCTQYRHFLLTHSHSCKEVQLPTYNNHNVTQFTVYTVPSLPADPLTLLHKVSNCQHTTTIMSHNLECTHYRHFLLTHSHSWTNCTTLNILHSFYSLNASPQCGHNILPLNIKLWMSNCGRIKRNIQI
jgi:hypothetical protein